MMIRAEASTGILAHPAGHTQVDACQGKAKAQNKNIAGTFQSQFILPLQWKGGAWRCRVPSELVVLWF